MADQCGEDSGLLPAGQYALKNLVLKTIDWIDSCYFIVMMLYLSGVNLFYGQSIQYGNGTSGRYAAVF
jgi:hypothetical protein